MAEARIQASQRGHIDTRTTVGRFLDDWLERKEREGRRPNTLLMYTSYVKRYISPSLGRFKLSELRHEHIDAFIQGLIVDKVKPTTIHRIHATVSSAMGSAFTRELIPSNPAANVMLPKRDRREPTVWEPEEAGAFLDSVQEHRLAPLFATALHTGMRRGELCGLRWTDVDFAKRIITVKVQLTAIAGKTQEGLVKTKDGQDRRIAFDDELEEYLLAWMELQDAERRLWGQAYEESGRVFTNEDGSHLRPDSVTDSFQRAVEQLGFRRIRFHDLRHTNASVLIAAGTPLAVISKRLGHASIAFTVDTYGHLLESANRDAADSVSLSLRARTTDRRVRQR